MGGVTAEQADFFSTFLHEGKDVAGHFFLLREGSNGGRLFASAPVHPFRQYFARHGAAATLKGR